MTHATFAERPSEAKSLYPYQEEAIVKILSVLLNKKDSTNILYQLPTGGGKTVIFSEVILQLAPVRSRGRFPRGMLQRKAINVAAQQAINQGLTLHPMMSPIATTMQWRLHMM